MQQSEPYAYFRPLIESDLPYFASCMGAAAGLSYARWGNILKCLEMQIRDLGEAGRLVVQVMAVEGRPVFLLELAGRELFLTGPPSWQKDPQQMMLAWQACLIYYFLRLRKQTAVMSIPEDHPAEWKALERIGCRQEGTDHFPDGLHYRYTCRSEELQPVI